MPKTNKTSADSEYIRHHEYDAWRFIQKSAKAIEAQLAKHDALTDCLNLENADAYKEPELFTPDARITEATYVWTLGAKTYNLLTGTPPFGSQGGKLLQKHKEAIDVSGHFSAQINVLLNKCLSAEPWKRPSISDIIDTSKNMMEKIDRNIIADRAETPTTKPETKKPEKKEDVKPSNKNLTTILITTLTVAASIAGLIQFLSAYFPKKEFSEKHSEITLVDRVDTTQHNTTQDL